MGATAKAQSAERREQETRRPTLLLVEDNPLDVAALKRALRLGECDYKVLSAETAAQASELLRTQPIDCILLDYKLPDMTGLDFMARLPRPQGLLSPPVIILTGYGSEQLAVQAMREGAADYLAKSVDWRYLNILPTLIERVMRENSLHKDFAEFQQLQHLILRSTAEGIISVDCDDTIRFVNPAAAQMLGWAEEDYEHRALHDRLKAFDAAGTELPSFSELCFSHKYDGTKEVWFQHREGVRFPVRCNSAPIMEGESITGGVIVFQDITEQHRMEAQLRRERNFSNAILDNADTLVMVLDENCRIVRFNQACERLTGYRFAEVKGRFAWDLLLPPEEKEEVIGVFTQLRGDNLPRRHIAHWLTREGKKRLIAWSNALLLEDNGNSRHVITSGIDISERKLYEDKLRLSANVLDNIVEGVIVTDPEGLIVTVNPAFSKITGYTDEECLGQTPRLLKSDFHPAEFYQQMWETIRDLGTWRGEVWNKRKNGEMFLVRETITDIKNADGDTEYYVAVLEDITELKQQEENIRHRAYHDALTDLPNRALFFDRLHQALTQARRTNDMVAVLFIDLDNFKTINDSEGHDLGDRLLQEAARRLNGSLRGSDTVSRLGGDEFTVILNHIRQPEDAGRIAAKIQERLAQPYRDERKKFTLSGSIGISLYPEHGTDAQTLIRNADRAMYETKRAGKNRYAFYHPGLEDDA